MLTSEMKDSGVEWIGEIPKKWEVAKLKVALKKEKKIVKEYKGENILSLTMNGVIIRDLVNPKGKMPNTFDGYQAISKGNIVTCLFDIDVTPRCVGIANADGLTSPAYTQFAVSNKFDTDFLYYYLLMLDNDKIIVPITKSLRNTIKNEDFLNLPFCFPNLNIQKKITERITTDISKINQLMRDTQKSIEELKIYKQSLITEVVTKGLDENVEMRDSKIEWMGKIPEKWKLAKTNQLFSIQKNIANKVGYDVLSVTQSGLKVKDINQNAGQMAADYSKYQIVKPGYFVMNHMDLLTGWIDIARQKGVTSPDYRAFYARNNNIVLNEFYLYVFQVCYMNKIFYGLGQGVSNLGRWRLQTEKFLNFYLPLPPYEEQKDIVEFLRGQLLKINSIIEQKRILVDELENYKKTIIYEYITGKKEIER
ncbi:restriction endonuclease subunit S [Paenibacillus amylolyticus]|uniref:restriction endonuclease subunit S n=1 Tax=Paenibacillus amylolyticus TaxID=1451 RepID=UPI003394DB44